MKRSMLVLLLLLTGFATTWAAVGSPLNVVEVTSQRMLTALRANRETLQRNPTRIYGLVNEILLPHFDFTLMSRWVLGRYWPQASTEQRERFTEEFRTLLVRTYSQALLEYSDEKIQYQPLPATATDLTDVTVRSTVEPKSGRPIPINYSLRLMNGDWKVYDITVDGVSLVTNYRGTFADQIRSQGMDAVIQNLAERNRKGTR